MENNVAILLSSVQGHALTLTLEGEDFWEKLVLEAATSWHLLESVF